MPLSGQQEPMEGVAPVVQNTLQDVSDTFNSNVEIDNSPTFDEIGDLYKRDWPTTSLLKGIADLGMESDPNFEQPWDDLDPKYYPYKHVLDNADSAVKWYRGISLIDQEIKDNELMSRMSLTDWAHYVSGQFVDPVSVVLAIGTGGIFTIGKGLSVGQAAARTSALAAGESAAIEGVLQLTDPLREVQDSAVSVVAGAAFGSFIGAGGQKMYNAFKGGSGSAVKKEIHRVVNEEVQVARADNSPVEATGTPRTNETPTNANEVDIDNVIDDMISDETPKFSPFKPIVHNRIMRSPLTILMYNKISPTFSRLGDMFGANNILKRGDYNGTRFNGKTLREEIKKTERRMFRQMYDESSVAQKILAKKNIKMSVDEIAVMAGRSARRGNTDYEIPDEVRMVGMSFRKQLDEWKERGIETGVLNEKAIKQLEDYVPRFYDLDYISKNAFKFRTVIKTWARTKDYDLDEDGLDDLVDSVHDTLKRINNGESHPMVFHVHRKQPKSGHAKPRRIDADDLDLEEFLISDVRILADRYARGVGADIIARELFGKDNIVDINGLPMPKAEYEQGIREFNLVLRDLEEKAAAGSKSAARKHKRIEKRRDATIEAAEHYLRAAMNRPIPPSKKAYETAQSFSRGLRGYSAAAGLGGVVESAFPDAANNITQHGLANLLLSTPQFFKALPAVFSRTPITNRTAVHWRDMDIALDNVLSSRMMAIADLESASQYGVKRGAFHGAEVARKAFRYFLADRWNTGAKLLAATTAQRAILRDASKMARGKISKQRGAKMHRIGMTEDMAARIDQNVRRHGKNGGLINIGDWDQRTADDLKRMLFRESEFQVVAPDGGEMPALFDNEIGRLFMQYKTFMLSHTLKQLVPMSQRFFMGDMSVLAGMTALGGLGIWARYVKDVTASFEGGEGFDVSAVNEKWANYTPMDYASIAVNDGAVLSYVPAFIGALDNLMNNELGESVGMTPRKRAYSPGLGIEQKAAGLGYAGNVAAASWNAAQAAGGYKEYTARDLNRVRRAVPMQNTFYLQWLFDWGEQEAVEALNLPESSKKKSSFRN
jgi:hypothetical protein